ncbi:MAG: cytochrome D1 domain-containing protein [Chthonomonadales bacterium]
MAKRRKWLLTALALAGASGILVLVRLRTWGEAHVLLMTGDKRWVPNCLICHMGAGIRPSIGWRDVEPYRTPQSIAVSRDGRRLYVSASGCDRLLVVDSAARKVVAEVPVGHRPHGVCLSPDGKFAYVTNRWSASVSVVDTAALRVTRTIPVGQGPAGVAVTPDGSKLYTANSFAQDISVVNLASGAEEKRLEAGRRPMAIALSSDGKYAYVSSTETLPIGFRTSPVTEVTVLSARRGIVIQRLRLRGAHMIEGIAALPVAPPFASPTVLATLVRPKNLIPAVQVGRGWMITDGLAILRPALDAHTASPDDTPAKPRIQQVLLDDPDIFYADPCDIVVTPDGRKAYISHSGADTVSVADLRSLMRLVKDPATRPYLADSLASASRFITKRIATGACPRGLAVSPDGAWVYVADALADKIEILSTAGDTVVGSIDLGGPRRTTLIRRGERLFHSASHTFQGQFSCRSCHPDGANDGLSYELESNGIGVNIVDNRSLFRVNGTAPFKWNGVSASLYRQCGPRFAAFITRSEAYTPDELAALVAYIVSLEPYPNSYRAPGSALTPAQQRGKALFERSVDNNGVPIPPGNRCITCHPPPLYTDHRKHDVDTAGPTDTKREFDTPHLMNVSQTAPYLHDGRAQTLEEIWTKYGTTNRHGAVNDLLKEQLNDLIEYVKTL